MNDEQFFRLYGPWKPLTMFRKHLPDLGSGPRRPVDDESREPADDPDRVAAIAPLLDHDARGWLADYTERCEPAGHPWLGRLKA